MRRFGVLILIAALAVGCAQRPSDIAIATDIKSKLAADPELKALKLDVAVSNGEVTLSGEVLNAETQLKAFKLALTIPGVGKVRDAMKLPAAGQPPTAQANEPEPERVPEPPVAQRAAPPVSVTGSRRSQPRPASPAATAPPAAPATVAAVPASSPASPAPASKAEPPAPKAAVEAPAATVAPAVRDAAAAAPAAPSKPRPTQVTIPTDTPLAVRIADPIDSAVNKVGEVFRATLDAPVVVDDQEVVPEKTDVFVELVQARSAGRMSGQSELELSLHSMELAGRTYRLSSTSYEQVGKSRGKDTALKVGIGAGIGAAIGAIAGGGKGAAIGAGVGAGAGTAVQVLTRGQQVKVPQETLLEFKLKAPVSVPYTPGPSQSRNR